MFSRRLPLPEPRQLPWPLEGRRLGQLVSRLNHDFSAVAGGTLYVSSLTVGTTVPVLRRILNPLVHRTVFTRGHGASLADAQR